MLPSNCLGFFLGHASALQSLCVMSVGDEMAFLIIQMSLCDIRCADVNLSKIPLSSSIDNRQKATRGIYCCR
jgi:hypothetical protein